VWSRSAPSYSGHRETVFVVHFERRTASVLSGSCRRGGHVGRRRPMQVSGAVGGRCSGNMKTLLKTTSSRCVRDQFVVCYIGGISIKVGFGVVDQLCGINSEPETTTG